MNSKGFTLIELLMVVAIISMTMAMGLPSFRSIVASSRLTATANAMVSALQLARFEALKQHKAVVIAHKQGGTWESGWDVFVDLNGDEIPQANEQILVTTLFDSVNAMITVTSNGYDKYVTYGANGRVVGIGGHFTFCSSSTQDYRSVVIAATGRIRVETPTSCT